jgi:hypothetical protein
MDGSEVITALYPMREDNTALKRWIEPEHPFAPVGIYSGRTLRMYTVKKKGLGDFMKSAIQAQFAE